jgi:glycerol uptake facilitator-like aquaporin
MKRYMMEFVGTFFLTMAISLTGNPIAIGLMLIAMIYVGGHVSGGHFNPAISMACFVQKKMSLHSALWYCAAQSLGASLALFFFMMVTGNVFSLEMGAESTVAGPFAVEALFVMVFCWVYLTMVVGGRYKATPIHGIVIGLTLMAIVFIGGIFNPAVAMAAVCCSVVKNGMIGDMAPMLIYVAGPLVGGAVAPFVYDYFNEDDQR